MNIILDMILGYVIATTILAGIFGAVAGLTVVAWDWHARRGEGRSCAHSLNGFEYLSRVKRSTDDQRTD